MIHPRWLYKFLELSHPDSFYSKFHKDREQPLIVEISVEIWLNRRFNLRGEVILAQAQNQEDRLEDQ